ncbi:TetR/AcrR family transcriptional regulator [Agromyces aurantiacus]|uniref:TetR/AcrR family transcriptional regulator n=1 Tax=Agromyces aurantiacus TaxID=165814 RepID=A0ABV9R674_9MICO|nr:TetR/AcrR family transcriptional regulator [Agromyces aurantiacus]MBM7503794.1 AcrR family transcriptional regulator [Agromyces aurantiacus]
MTDPALSALLVARRPTRADARRNFDALVEAAREAFAEHGVDASLEDIARRAGVGIGTLYRNFPTRDALVEAVYLDEVAGVAAFADGLGDQSPFDALAAWLRRFADYASRKRVLLDGLNRDSELLQTCRVVMYQAGEPLLRRAQEAGEVRGDVGIDDVVRLVAGVAGVAFPTAEQRERVVALALDGLRAR